jgi:hypothetical protein
VSHNHDTSNGNPYRVERKLTPPACPDSGEPLTEERVAYWCEQAEAQKALTPGFGWDYLLLQRGLAGAWNAQVVARLEGRA